ncbi:MAG: hypothetical protein II942_02645 [Alphaproteobacteria bacterium]|nr:hypothetical protein [Alphaproteobacteria bacterium]
MTYYELLQDNTIGRSTNNEKVAKKLGLTLTTDKEIVGGYDGKRYFKGEEPSAPEASYSEKRAAEYPSIADQLDMIYWDKVNGTNLWVEKITAIKTKYPKE